MKSASFQMIVQEPGSPLGLTAIAVERVEALGPANWGKCTGLSGETAGGPRR